MGVIRRASFQIWNETASFTPLIPASVAGYHELTFTVPPMTYSGPINDARAPRVETRSVRVAKAGASFGTALAIAISWSQHKSIIWACIHGILSWFYVAYYAVTR